MFANFATLVGVYDATLYNGVVVDTSSTIGSGDLALASNLSQYLLNNNVYTSPPAVSGNGMTVMGWFYPTGTQATNAAIFDISSSTSPNNSMYVTCSTANSPTLTGYYNGVGVTTSNTATLNAWNFFTYIVLFNGTNATQFLYLNGVNAALGSTVNYAGGVAYNSQTIGYGPGLNYFNGKIDDFRFYTRVMTPPELNVLYRYNYKLTDAALVPTVKLVKDVATSSAPATANIVLDLSGTFSYVNIARSVTLGVTGVAANYNISCAATTTSANFTYTKWTDVSASLTTGNIYTYLVTPYVLNTAGPSASITITV
jgi:hypothetical protein